MRRGLADVKGSVGYWTCVPIRRSQWDEGWQCVCFCRSRYSNQYIQSIIISKDIKVSDAFWNQTGNYSWWYSCVCTSQFSQTVSISIENICQQETEALPNIGLNKSVFIEVWIHKIVNVKLGQTSGPVDPATKNILEISVLLSKPLPDCDFILWMITHDDKETVRRNWG